MPPARRTAGRAPVTGGRQASLSFNNKVTKPVVKSAKSAKNTTCSAPVKQSPLAKHVSSAAELPATEEQIERVCSGAAIGADEEEEVAVALALALAPEKTEAGLSAGRITASKIETYWRRIESGRRAKSVHQDDLSVGEKVLRYFDASSQYGPCVGIGRLKRWQRAERLGLNPPLEVLAVLLQDEKKGIRDQRAHMDEILNSMAVGAN